MQAAVVKGSSAGSCDAIQPQRAGTTQRAGTSGPSLDFTLPVKRENMLLFGRARPGLGVPQSREGERARPHEILALGDHCSG